MEGFSFVTPVTGLNRPHTGKEDDDAWRQGIFTGSSGFSQSLHTNAPPIRS
jgi:hypothetical protein